MSLTSSTNSPARMVLILGRAEARTVPGRLRELMSSWAVLSARPGGRAAELRVEGRPAPRRHGSDQLVPHVVHHALRVVETCQQISQLLGGESRVGHDGKR